MKKEENPSDLNNEDIEMKGDNTEEVVEPTDAQANGNEIKDDEEGPVDQAEEIAKLTADVEASKDKYLRLYSEFENFRRRTAKEKLDMVQSANEQLLKSLLPVVDDFERAANAVANVDTDETKGFLLIQSKLKKILEQSGLKVMAIEKGSDFDSDMQEAITQIPVEEEELKGRVVDVVEKGYLLNDKVVRYAKVVIGN